jgi:hypothetical protein
MWITGKREREIHLSKILIYRMACSSARKDSLS